ncbi:MAG: histone deacetylase [Candidatus Nezhaarchaeota archaeon]|nr:histone deacetylase [Candidatus Nezhaarchaeota archaeon]
MDELKCCMIYGSVFLGHDTGPFHPENPQRLIKTIRLLEEKGAIRWTKVEEPVKASLDDLTLVHEEDYINHVEEAVAKGQKYLDPDTPISKDSFDVALFAAGAAILGCKKVLHEGFDACFVLQRPPGHHAGRRGRALGAPTQGFCIFNNVAIAAMYLLEKCNVGSTAIFDFDCHHGNGTQEIFYSDGRVLYISTHQDGRTAYPGTGFIDEVGDGDGEGFNINIPLPPFTGDDVYEEVLRSIVEKVLAESRPSVLLFSAGFDAHKDDPITSLNLSTKSFVEIAEMTKRLRQSGCTKGFIFILEGGYGVGLPEGVYSILATLMGSHSLVIDEKTFSTSAVKDRCVKVMNEVSEKVLRPYWGL